MTTAINNSGADVADAIAKPRNALRHGAGMETFPETFREIREQEVTEEMQYLETDEPSNAPWKHRGARMRTGRIIQEKRLRAVLENVSQ